MHVCLGSAAQLLAIQRERDAAKIHSDLSEDLFKVHDFDVKIDLQVPNAGAEKLCCFLPPPPPPCLQAQAPLVLKGGGGGVRGSCHQL